tara:strand:- start:4022 stop:6649 length:2628 start_codon:yes stop_codon:yes gene_type:complete
MSYWIAGAIIVYGTSKAISGYQDKKKAKEKQNAAETGLQGAQDRLTEIDTSNPFEDAENFYAGLDNKMSGLENVYEGAENVYEDQKNVYAGMENKMKGQKNAFTGLENQFENMENAFEDLTVNTQQAEFEAQQNAQMQANIMSSMGAAAGGSGIAALAQSMANQSALQSQKSAASIGSQEAANQKLAAEAEQGINMATASEASKLQMVQASEESRLDTQERTADMEIQRIQMGAEEAMQAAELGEASKIQMATLGEASNLQMAEAMEASKLQELEASGEMQIQQLKGEGDMWSAGMDLKIGSTLMDSYMSQYEMYGKDKEAGDDKMWKGIGDMIGGIGKAFSDERLKENIIKIKYSDSGIPIYQFNYKGKKETWNGTMAQDLIKLGRKDAVIKVDGYYKVNYNLIDVDMKEIKPSPLKQLGKTPQEEVIKTKAMNDAGLDIIGGGTARKNWEELQLDIKNVEPRSMRIRKLKDKNLRDIERNNIDTILGMPDTYTKTGVFKLIKNYKRDLEKAMEEDDEIAKGVAKKKTASLAQLTKAIQNSVEEFRDDQFNPESLLSKGVSQQQVSFATQMYCQNPNLIVFPAEKQDVLTGYTDYYGELVVEDSLYCVVEDFYGNEVMINALEGNKDMFIRDNLKFTEYLTFLNETYDSAQEAREDKSAVKIDLGRIDYKIDSLFGFNDGTASKEQDELVMMFCHDSEVLRDGSTFRRHLYQHPNIKNLNYGGFDWNTLTLNLPLGPGDKNYWTDEVDDLDRLLLVDAIVNVDSPYFNIKLLRTLVKEYYTTKIENAWWKGMGYPEGKIEIMRLKINTLTKARFKKEKAEAAQNGMLKFVFDGEVYPTGMTKAKVKKQEEERGEAAEKAQKEVAANQTNTGLNQ